MAEKRTSPALAFVVGALVVIVAGLGWYVYTGHAPGADEPEIQIDLPGNNG